MSNSKNKPTNCTCKPVYDELHWEWCHSAECLWDKTEEKFDPQEAYERRQRATKQRVLYAVRQNKAHCVAPHLLKEFAPETYAELCSH